MDQSIGIGKTAILPIGNSYHLKRGKDHIVYAGTVSEDVYCIVQVKASGYQGYAWPLYYPKRRRDIIIDGIKLYIERVTPEEIEIRVT